MNRHNESLWVVVPFYNEEKLILDTLNALRAQDDTNFRTVVVDNASTDQSPAIVREFRKKYPDFALEMTYEPQKGTGAASDTGFRYAITHGATIIARTDADALPAPTWISLLKKDFRSGALIVGGRIAPRTDEANYKWYDGFIFRVLIRLVERAPGVFYRRPGQRYRMFMVAGLNMAIDAALYDKVGGFPRTSIDDTDEDLELHLKVCQVIEKHQARLNTHAVVYGSIRKAKSMGYIGILMWYWDRKYTPDVIDVR